MKLASQVKYILRLMYPSAKLARLVGTTTKYIDELRQGIVPINQISLGLTERFVALYRKRRSHQKEIHNEKGIANVHDVKDKLHNSYLYDIYYPDGSIHIHRAQQPEVHIAGYQAFIIKTPYFYDHSNRIILYLFKRRGTWFLITDPNRNFIQQTRKLESKLSQKQIKRILHFLVILRTKYSIGSTRIAYYVPLYDRSLQSAYYRLISFNLSYYTILRYEFAVIANSKH